MGVLRGTQNARKWTRRVRAGRAVLVARGNCTFVTKALNVQLAGGVAMLLYDTQPGARSQHASSLVHNTAASSHAQHTRVRTLVSVCRSVVVSCPQVV